MSNENGLTLHWPDFSNLGDMVILSLVLGVLLVVVLAIWSYVWLYRDAERRGKSGCLVVLMVLLIVGWPIGLIAWLVFRPSSRRRKR